MPQAVAQFAPQAGVPGSKAIRYDDPRFVAWANGCTIQRGWLDIADKPQGKPVYGDSFSAIGKIDNNLVSLGDSGIAVLTFEAPLYNGDGPDFAIFENGFANPADPEEAFLEFAFVEVSSDGVNYVRFPATSLTDTPQVPGAGVYINARKVNNLAGKYIDNYGTPFDLDELKGIPELDVDNITHIRLVDVVGAVNELGTKDHNGNQINDPYPTVFPSGGFDLDAVGVIYMKGKWPAGLRSVANNDVVSIYPNPAHEYISINHSTSGQVFIYNSVGSLMHQTTISGSNTEKININQLHPGVYYITVMNENGNRWTGKFSKY